MMTGVFHKLPPKYTASHSEASGLPVLYCYRQNITFAAFKCLALSYISLDLFVCYIITIDVFMFPVSDEAVCVSE